jgi:hypothetical protein
LDQSAAQAAGSVKEKVDYRTVLDEATFEKFGEQAHNAGFRDFTKYNSNNDSIALPLPKNVRPDTYTATLNFDGRCSEKTFTVDFSVLYPASVMEQRWNDVIVLKNPAFNGGYEFYNHWWFVNDQPLREQYNRGNYIYMEHSTLQFGAEYRVRLMRMNEHERIFSCPLIVKEKPHDDEYVFPFPRIQVTELKNAVRISCEEPIVEVQLITMHGQVRTSRQYAHREIDFNVDAGFYILRLTTEKGHSYSQKINVK